MHPLGSPKKLDIPPAKQVRQTAHESRHRYQKALGINKKNSAGKKTMPKSKVSGVQKINIVTPTPNDSVLYYPLNPHFNQMVENLKGFS